MKNKLKKELLFDFLILALGTLFIVLFWQKVVLLSILLILLYLVGKQFWHKKHDHTFYLVGAILGPVVEIICIQFNVWNYTLSTFLGIPLWLPFAWGLVSIMLIRIAEIFVKIEKKV